MDNLNVVNDTQGAVVAPPTESDCAIGENGGSATRPQSHSQNSGFKRMRLENEQYRKEIEQLKGEVAELSKLKDLQKTSDVYLNKLVSDKMERDLSEIRNADPSVESLYELGDDFLRLVECGIEPIKAYFAIKDAGNSKKAKRPPSLSPVATNGFSQNPYYSSKELDRLTARDLENPGIFKKAMESLKKL